MWTLYRTAKDLLGSCIAAGSTCKCAASFVTSCVESKQTQGCSQVVTLRPQGQCFVSAQQLPALDICGLDLCACAQVDIYSFGIILWELVTLSTPARGNLRSVKVPEECPSDLARLIEDCLEANNPDKRPTASEIYDRLMARHALRGARLLPASHSQFLFNEKHFSYTQRRRGGMKGTMQVNEDVKNWQRSPAPYH